MLTCLFIPSGFDDQYLFCIHLEIHPCTQQLSNSIEKDHGEVVADLVVKSKEISELQDRVAVVRSKADMFRGRIAGWGSFMDGQLSISCHLFFFIVFIETNSDKR